MTRPRRQPQHLSFKGWWVDGPEIRVQTRMVVSVGGGKWQETGPNLTVIIPADALLDEDIVNAAFWAQHRDEQRRLFQQMEDERQAQEPLF